MKHRKVAFFRGDLIDLRQSFDGIESYQIPGPGLTRAVVEARFSEPQRIKEERQLYALGIWTSNKLLIEIPGLLMNLFFFFGLGFA